MVDDCLKIYNNILNNYFIFRCSEGRSSLHLLLKLLWWRRALLDSVWGAEKTVALANHFAVRRLISRERPWILWPTCCKCATAKS